MPEQVSSAIENKLTAEFPQNEAQTQLSLTQRMTEKHVPNVSLAVFDEEGIKTGTYGFAEASDAHNTLFQAGSISKVITATLVLKLIELDILKSPDPNQDILDVDVNDLLKTWKVPYDEFFNPYPENCVTMRQLLSHTAGLNVPSFPGYSSDTAILPDNVAILDGSSSAAVNTDKVKPIQSPGRSFQYSGGGTQILQQIIEDVTQKPFEAVAREYLFDQLDMPLSTFKVIRPGEYPEGSMALGHHHDGGMIEGQWQLHPESAAAGLWTTPTELARFFIALQNHQILSDKMLSEMLTQQHNTPCGLGPFINIENQDDKEFNHSGATKGFTCEFVGFLNAKKGAVIMTNRSDADQLIQEIKRSIASVYQWPENYANHPRTARPVDAEAYKTWEGEYVLNIDGMAIKTTVFSENDTLFLAFPYPEPDSLPQTFRLQQTDHELLVVSEEGARILVQFLPNQKLVLFGQAEFTKQKSASEYFHPISATEKDLPHVDEEEDKDRGFKYF